MYQIEISTLGTSTFRIASAIISLTCIFYTLLMQHKRSMRGRLFLSLLIIILIDSLVGLVAASPFFGITSFKVGYFIRYICELIYYFTHFSMPIIFFLYIANVCYLNYKFISPISRAIYLPFVFMEILLISNPLTNAVFTIDGNMAFHRGVGVYIAYIISAFYIVLCAIILTKYWNTINNLKRLAMFYFIALAVAGIVIQMIFPDILCELLCESIGTMGLMIMIEKEDDKIDNVTKAYNRYSLINDLNTFIKMQIPFRILCIRIDNSETYRRITGFEDFDYILNEIADFLIALSTDCNVYKVGDACFFMLCPLIGDEEMMLYATSIDERFKQGFKSSGGTTTISEIILCANIPEQFNTTDDIILLSDAPVEMDEPISILSNEQMDFIIRIISMEKAISSGISEQNYHVLFQPIYGKKCGCIRAMQALLSLDDPTLGQLHFNEFMPIAERVGLADTLEEKMIENIFRFVGQDLPEENLGIDFVLIHLMSVKVVHKGLIETIMGLKYKYNVDPTLIAFDIDDTILNYGNESLSYVINELYDAGFRLFLGNYDITNLGQNEDVLEKFKGVILTAWKFLDDKYISQGQMVLKNRTDMLGQLKKDVIITGVDDGDCYKGIADSIALYMSGKYLSPPLSKNEIIERFLAEDKIINL